MKKKNIHIVNRYFYPVTAGIETCLFESYRRLVKKGWNITIHTSKNRLTERNVLSSKANVKGIKVNRYNYGRFSFFPNIPYSKTNIVVINNFDILPHLFILSKILLLKAVGKKQFSLVLATHGGFTPDWLSFSFKARFIKKTYHNTLGALIINLVVDKIHAVSTWEGEELIKNGIRKDLIHVINNGVEDSAFKKTSKPKTAIKLIVKRNKPYILQLGRIHPIKNNDSAIKALSYMPKKIKLIIAGPVHDEPYKKKLEELVSNLHLEKRVLFLGSIYGDDKYYLLKNADALVQLSSVEASSITVLEALSQGLICVVSKHPALTNVVKDGVNGYNYNVNDSKRIGNKLSYINRYKKSAELEKMRILNRQIAKSMTWEKVAENMNSMYKDLVSSKKTSSLHIFEAGRGILISARSLVS